jgi:quaternary ammonium compound-resistance protein SugE
MRESAGSSREIFVPHAPFPTRGNSHNEWSLPSPPQFHQFDTLPRIAGPSLGDAGLESAETPIENSNLEPQPRPDYHLAAQAAILPVNSWRFVMAWIYLVVAGLFEISWAIGLKYTEGFTRLLPSLGTIASMILSIVLLGLALKTLPVGTAYAVWTGIGAVGTAVLGIYLFAEPATALRADMHWPDPLRNRRSQAGHVDCVRHRNHRLRQDGESPAVEPRRSPDYQDRR